MKRILSLLLCLCLCITLLPSAVAEDIALTDPAAPDAEITASAVASGTCGDNLTWTLDDQGTLTISGTGAMWDFSIEDHPGWYEKVSDIRMLEVKSGVTSIGSHAFRYCKNMSGISLPENLTRIGDYAFFGCGFIKVSLPESLTQLGDGAFSDCGNLTDMMIPEGVTSIGDATFQYCAALSNVKIPEGVTSIGSYAFHNCTSLWNLAIPESVTSFGDFAFLDCYNLKTAGPIGENYTFVLGGDYNYLFGWKEYIPDKAFFNCIRLKSVTLPETLKGIGARAFERCSYMESILFPETLTIIGESAFEDCSSLSQIRFMGPAPQIDEFAFHGVTATAYYPAGDPTWTAAVMKDYGGQITWEPFNGYSDTVTDYTNGAVNCSLNVASTYSGKISFTVSSTNDRAVLVAVRENDNYTVLGCLTNGATHSYTVNMTKDAKIVLALKGDANLDGELKSLDGTMIKRRSLGTFALNDPLKELVCDVNGDGEIKSLEGTMVIRASLGTYQIPW